MLPLNSSCNSIKFLICTNKKSKRKERETISSLNFCCLFSTYMLAQDSKSKFKMLFHEKIHEPGKLTWNQKQNELELLSSATKKNTKSNTKRFQQFIDVTWVVCSIWTSKTPERPRGQIEPLNSSNLLKTIMIKSIF